MRISERTVGDVTVLDLEGRLILDDGFEPLRVALNRLIGDGRRKLLLNLAGGHVPGQRGRRLDRVQVRHAVPAQRPAEALQSPFAQPRGSAHHEVADGVRCIPVGGGRAPVVLERRAGLRSKGSAAVAYPRVRWACASCSSSGSVWSSDRHASVMLWP